jgi:hypothetical protein
MPKREGELMRTRSAIRGDKLAEAAQSEALVEREVGEPMGPQPLPGLATTLRPQQGRNVVWRWHLRRRQRAR